ncbi:MAG: HIT domain-containing protein, partial [Deltaproteobacteria bacterium]|nr:HIT domain-containing protein [Deltaproteobacteria bacterium]
MEKPLWAPWRMEFIEAKTPEGCIFCLFPAEQGEEADRRNLIVHRSPRAFTILNRFPYNNGHLLVVPRAHLARLEDLEPADFADLQEELRRAVGVIRAAYRPEGLNVG